MSLITQAVCLSVVYACTTNVITVLFKHNFLLILWEKYSSFNDWTSLSLPDCPKNPYNHEDNESNGRDGEMSPALLTHPSQAHYISPTSLDVDQGTSPSAIRSHYQMTAW